MTLQTSEEFRKIRLCKDLDEDLPEDILPVLTTLYFAWQSLWNLGGKHMASEDGEIVDFIDMLEQHWPSRPCDTDGKLDCY